MRIAILAAAALLCTAAAVDAAPRAPREAAVRASVDVEGTWEMEDAGTGRVQLTLQWGTSTWSRPQVRADFGGLDAGVFRAGAAATPARVRLEREGGVFQMDGTFRSGKGAGRFRFTPAPGFGPALQAAGIRGAEGAGEEDVMRLALAGVTVASARELASAGLGTLDMRSVTELVVHDVTPEFVRTMRSLGVDGMDSPAGPVEMRIHGVTPQFVRDMQALGYRPTRTELVQMRIHRVTPELVRAFRAMGYESIPAQDLLAMRIHGVTPQYVRTLRGAGLGAGSTEALAALRNQGVTAELVREVAALGNRELSGDDLLQLGAHGVTAEDVRELRALGFETLTPGQIRDMRVHGVTPDFIRQVRAAGFTNASPEALVRMKVEGLDAEVPPAGRGGH